MKASQWLAAVASVLPGEKSAKRTSSLRQFAPKLALDVAEWRLDGPLVDAVAPRLPADATLTYPVLLGAVRQALDERGDDVAPRGGGGGSTASGAPLSREQREAQIVTDAWINYVGRRLGEGGPRALLCSLLRRYCPDDGYRRAMSMLFPAELAEEDSLRDRRRGDMAQRREAAAAAAAAKAMAMPPASRQRPVTTRPMAAPGQQAPRALPLSSEKLADIYRAQARQDDPTGWAARQRLGMLEKPVAEPVAAPAPARAIADEPPPPSADDYFQGYEEDAR